MLKEVFKVENKIVNSKIYKQTYAKLKISSIPQQTVHFEWEELSDIFSELLSGLLGREIKAQSDREEYYYWLIRLFDTPITKDELGILFELADADDWDREQNDYGEYPIKELCQSLCSKLMGKLLPFVPRSTMADDEGVWFISSVTDSVFIEKALPGGMSLIAGTWNEPEYPGIRISLRIAGRNDELLCFAEHNSAKPEGKELCITAYSFDQDEPAYYECYYNPGLVSPNV